jgi:predicted HicB family RNase H-like nuclease
VNTLSYRGYLARVDFDDEDNLLVGKIVGIEDGVTFHSDNVTELEAAFREAVEDYLETCAKVGKTPELSYSGRLTIEVDPDLHRRAAREAEKAGLDLTQWAKAALENAIGGGQMKRTRSVAES